MSAHHHNDRRRRRLPSPAMAVALLALFVSLGGTTVAATKLSRGSVGQQQLRAGAVTTSKLRNATVTSMKVADGSLSGADVADGSLTGVDIDLARLGKVPAAADADSVGGHAVGCAAGTVTAVAVCAEPSTRAPLGLLDAIAACAADGRRLPATTELLGLRALGVQLADPELTADVTRSLNPSATTPLVQRSLYADGTTLVDEQTSAPHRFRCMGSPVR